jgi:hypothetical protein
MTPERMFHELLGSGLNWEVIDCRFEAFALLLVREVPMSKVAEVVGSRTRGCVNSDA